MSGHPAAGDQVALVLGERLRHRHRLADVGVLAADQLARAALGGPEVENDVAAGILEVVGCGKALGPRPALAIGAADEPRSGTEVAAIAQRDPWGDRDEIGLATDLETEPRGASFQSGRAKA